MGEWHPCTLHGALPVSSPMFLRILLIAFMVYVNLVHLLVLPASRQRPGS